VPRKTRGPSKPDLGKEAPDKRNPSLFFSPRQGRLQYLKRQRNSLNSFAATKRTSTFEFTGRNDENGTSLDDVVGLITDLKKIIIEQGNTIENAKADLAEIKSEQENLKSQNIELQDEIRSLRTQLSAYSGSIPTGSVPSPG
jgi:chromosome segregation ATPase